MMSFQQVPQFVITSLMVLSVIVGCSGATPPTASNTPAATIDVQATTSNIPAATIDSQAFGSEIDTMFQKITTAGNFRGAVLVAQNGRVHFAKGYGMADQDKQISNTTETKFRIASLTKQFTAMAIMILQEQGKLRVQDNICKYLADCPVTWNPITIHHLLTHTSGIPNTFDSFYMRDVGSATPLEAMITNVKMRPLNFQPGAKYSYSDTGYILVGKIIEAVSGQPYGVFLQEHIFTPLQMASTGLDNNQADLAVGHTTGVSVAPPFNPLVAFSAAGIYSTVEDLYRWDQALSTDKLVSQQVRDTIFSAHVETDDFKGWGYGYGWRIGPSSEQPFYVHGGIINGFRAIIKRYPNDNATIIILTNQENVDIYPLADEVGKKLFGNS